MGNPEWDAWTLAELDARVDPDSITGWGRILAAMVRERHPMSSWWFTVDANSYGLRRVCGHCGHVIVKRSPAVFSEAPIEKATRNHLASHWPEMRAWLAKVRDA